MNNEKYNEKAMDDELILGYRLEELVPIVAALTDRYTSKDSTSITYEKAEQLMEAVVYCIGEIQEVQEAFGEEMYYSLAGDKMSAQDAYDIGYDMVNQKAQDALKLYQKILKIFDAYGNRCLVDTVRRGMRQFFRWYDVRFNPQNTILTLDYPILADIVKLSGVDAIYVYLKCIYLEQQFLGRFNRNFVIYLLKKYNASYGEMVDNIAQVIYTYIIAYTLIGKELNEEAFSDTEMARLQEVLLRADIQQLEENFTAFTMQFTEKYYNNNQELAKYLLLSLKDSLLRLKNLAENNLRMLF